MSAMNQKIKTSWIVEGYAMRLKRNGHTRAIIFTELSCRTYFGVGPLFNDKDNPPQELYNNNLAKLKAELLELVSRGGFLTPTTKPKMTRERLDVCRHNFTPYNQKELLAFIDELLPVVQSVAQGCSVLREDQAENGRKARAIMSAWEGK